MMQASFWYAARYSVQASCLSPLRTGGPDGDPETVLLDRDGGCLIQGSSLAGAFREWVTNWQGPSLSDQLFGTQQNEGCLIVSDGRFAPDTLVGRRPRLRIDRATGTAARGGKFDLAQVEAGSSFSFEILWRGTERCPEQQKAVEAMLGAMQAGQIRLGAQKNNGLGRVALTVTKQFFDMHQPGDRTAWLEETGKGELLALPAVPGQRTLFVLEGEIDGLLVKASSSRFKQEGGKGSYLPNLEENGAAVLPGSSVKGAVRSWSERIAKSMNLTTDLTDQLFGAAPENQQQGRAGRVRVEDLRLVHAKKRQISRIRINRFTGGVIRQGLLTEEPLYSPVRLELSVLDATSLECALLLYALRDLGLGLYNLGSGWAVGRGLLQNARITVTLPDGRSLTMSIPKGGSCRLEDPDGVASEWSCAWKEAQA